MKEGGGRECWVPREDSGQLAVGSGQWARGRGSAECWVLSAEGRQLAVGNLNQLESAELFKTCRRVP